MSIMGRDSENYEKWVNHQRNETMTKFPNHPQFPPDPWTKLGSSENVAGMPTRIEIQMQVLGSSVSNLENVCAEIERKLQTVLMPENLANSAQALAETRPGSGLALAIMMLRERTDSAIARLQDVLDRLEV